MTNLELLKSYKWNSLYENVKDIQFNKTLPLQKQEEFALKTMLLSSWWSDNENPKLNLTKYPLIITNPLIHFCIVNAYIGLGDLEKVKQYINKPPKTQPKWMEIYLQLEYLGRSLKDEKQVQLLKSNSSSQLEEYQMTALLQSLDHAQCDLSFLKEFLLTLDSDKNTSPLFTALCIKVEILDYEKYLLIEEPIILAYCAKKLLKDYKLKEALIVYDKLAKLGFAEMNTIDIWLKISMTISQGKEHFFNRYQFSLSIVPNTLFAHGTISCYALIQSWIIGDYTKAYAIASKYHTYKDKINKRTKAYQVFYIYTISLCAQWQLNRKYYESEHPNEISSLLVFGESHSMSPSNIYFNWNGKYKIGKTKFVMGVKMYHLATSEELDQTVLLLEQFKDINTNDDVLLTIGEIDTRPDEGMWQVYLKKGIAIDKLIDDTITGYINFLEKNLKTKKLSSITIQGVPAPAYALKGDKDPKDEKGFLTMIKNVNDKLKELTLSKGWNFLDVYSATVGEDGKSNKKWHIDGYHLSPVFYPIEADKWLIKPEPKEQSKSTAIDFSKYQTISLSKPS